MRLGILPLGRATFDVPFAEEKLDRMLAALDATGHEVVGPRRLLTEADPTRAAIEELSKARLDRLLILQVTFTDAAMTKEAARAIEAPIAIWAVPEPRNGGRLRLNAFCGLNLASHAFGLMELDFGWFYGDPSADIAADLADLLGGHRQAGRIEPSAVVAPTNGGAEVVRKLEGKRIGRIGAHPDGFDTCAYDAGQLKALAGVDVDEIALPELFECAHGLVAERVERLRSDISGTRGLEDVDQGELERSLRLKVALDDMRAARDLSAFAIRCWPETFTEYGGAICGPVALQGEARIPCACEADVYGALTQLILQEVSDAPVFLTDLVDMDVEDDTGVVWHCGQAPREMAAGQVAATIHTNRKMPLLFEFPLKPGQVTLMRISQAHGTLRMVLAGGEMLDRPSAFTGTSGVLRFERAVKQVLPDVIASGLEHHMALAYGDHREELRGVASALNVPVLEL